MIKISHDHHGVRWTWCPDLPCRGPLAQRQQAAMVGRNADGTRYAVIEIWRGRLVVNGADEVVVPIEVLRAVLDRATALGEDV